MLCSEPVLHASTMGSIPLTNHILVNSYSHLCNKRGVSLIVFFCISSPSFTNFFLLVYQLLVEFPPPCWFYYWLYTICTLFSFIPFSLFTLTCLINKHPLISKHIPQRPNFLKKAPWKQRIGLQKCEVRDHTLIMF